MNREKAGELICRPFSWCYSYFVPIIQSIRIQDCPLTYR